MHKTSKSSTKMCLHVKTSTKSLSSSQKNWTSKCTLRSIVRYGQLFAMTFGPASNRRKRPKTLQILVRILLTNFTRKCTRVLRRSEWKSIVSSWAKMLSAGKHAHACRRLTLLMPHCRRFTPRAQLCDRVGLTSSMKQRSSMVSTSSNSQRVNSTRISRKTQETLLNPMKRFRSLISLTTGCPNKRH